MNIEPSEQKLFNDLSKLIEQSKNQVVIESNYILNILFWQVGNLIDKYILESKRAEYGKQIVVSVSRQLIAKYGRNFEEKNLRRMIQFSQLFPDYENVVTLSRHLSWSHFLAILPQKIQTKMQFYATKSISESWNVRELRKQISIKTFERMAIANTQLSEKVSDSENVFKDPYLLDFLPLRADYLEKDLEDAILRDLEKFILELGNGFTFVSRQKRMIIDDDDFYLDLLFFHRNLKRLVAIELKIGKFKPKYKGQMELYLKWLNRYEKLDGEKTPIGLILCTETSKEQIELLEMHKDGILVAEYMTELPAKEVLEIQLQKSLIEAQERFEKRKLLE